MAVGEHDGRPTLRRALELGDETLAAGDDLMQALAARTTVVEQVPPGLLLFDLGVGQALVRAVVVFGKGIDHDRFDARHGTSCRFHSALQWAGEHQRQGTLRQRRQERRQAVGLVASLLDQREIGAAGVPSIFRPFRGAVSHEQDQRGTGDHRIGHECTP